MSELAIELFATLTSSASVTYSFALNYVVPHYQNKKSNSLTLFMHTLCRVVSPYYLNLFSAQTDLMTFPRKLAFLYFLRFAKL